MCVALTGVKGVTASRDRRGGGGEKNAGRNHNRKEREREFKGGTHKIKPTTDDSVTLFQCYSSTLSYVNVMYLYRTVTQRYFK